MVVDPTARKDPTSAIVFFEPKPLESEGKALRN